MITIKSEINIEAPILEVWNALTHHEGMIEWPGFTSVEILKKGTSHPNGLGCIRKVKAEGMVVTEEITRYDTPHTMDYQVLEINFPIIHKGGTVSLKEVESGTSVIWTSKFVMKSNNKIIKFIGGKILKFKGESGFSKSLRWVKTKMEQSNQV